MQPLKKVACPHCGKLSPFTPANEWRPFCSERCKMIDLGAWAAESYRVASEDEPAQDEEPSPKPRES